MNKRLYPISEKEFAIHINPLIISYYSRAGRPQTVSNYQVFCAMLYVLRTGIPWRDLPECYGYWHTVYLRFKKGSDRGVWWSIIIKLQQLKKIKMAIVMSDSTTFKVHRHGGGLKGGSKPRVEIVQV
jgi:transposase